MKNKSTLLKVSLLSIVCAMGCYTQAQVAAPPAIDPAGTTVITATNAAPMPSFSSGLQEIYDTVTVSTNYAFAAGYMRATTGNRNLGYADYVYNVSQNIGLVIGYDYLWTAKKSGVPSQANLVKGGLTISATIAPLKNFGLTNVLMKPFATGLVATGAGQASTILTAGDEVDLVTFHGWDFGLALQWESRQDAGFWDGKYLGGFGVIKKGF